MVRFLHILRPILKSLPEVESPDRKIPFRERMLWTVLVMLIMLVGCNLPLYGVPRDNSPDPFYWMRVLMASNRGTIMELGIAPIITGGLIMQFLSGWRYIDVNQHLKDDRGLFSGAHKLLGLVLTVIEAVLYVMCGTYGPVSELGVVTSFLIGLQLIMAGFVVIILDELMQKGYGIGSGVSLFVAVNSCENIFTAILGVTSIQTGRGTEYEGAFIALFHLLFSRSDKARALKEAFTRSNLPNIWNIVVTVVIFGAVVFFQGWRVELQVKFQRYRGQNANYPIKLFYTSNMPIIMFATIVTNIAIFSKILFSVAPTNFFTRIFGSWEEVMVSGQMGKPGVSIPVSGFAYYVSPPKSILELFTDFPHAVFYMLFVCLTCAFCSKKWSEVSGSDASDVARQLQHQQMVMKGHRETAMVQVLKRYIPTAAAFGGLVVGGLCVIGDFLGAIGGGTGVILAVTCVYQYYELLNKEQGGDMAESLGGMF